MSIYLYHKCVECNYRYYGGQDSSTPCPYCEITRLKAELAEKDSDIDKIIIKATINLMKELNRVKAENTALKEQLEEKELIAKQMPLIYVKKGD